MVSTFSIVDPSHGTTSKCCGWRQRIPFDVVVFVVHLMLTTDISIVSRDLSKSPFSLSSPRLPADQSMPGGSPSSTFLMASLLTMRATSGSLTWPCTRFSSLTRLVTLSLVWCWGRLSHLAATTAASVSLQVLPWRRLAFSMWQMGKSVCHMSWLSRIHYTVFPPQVLQPPYHEVQQAREAS